MNNTDAPPTVWLVSDSPSRRGALQTVLGRTNLAVVTFSSPEEALATLERGAPAPDLIITGLHMPNQGGIRFCRLLRSPAYAPLNQTPILATSAVYAGFPPNYLARTAGANAFCPLPVADETFLALVFDLLAGRIPIQRPLALLVDADEARLERLQLPLAALGYGIVRASSAAQAIAHCADSQPDVVVISDAALGPDPQASLAALSRVAPQCATLVVQTDVSQDSLIPWMALGASATLPEPVGPLWLAEAAESARKERFFGQISTLLLERNQALAESEERFRSLINQAGEALFLHTLDGRIVEVNRAACQQTGYTREELLRMSMFDIDRNAGEQEDVLSAWRALQPGDPPLIVRPYHTRRDGSSYLVEMSLTRVEYSGQAYILSLARDLSERIEMEQALAREHTLLRTVIDNLPISVYAKDLEGRKILTNPVDLAWIGANSADEVLGKTDLEVYPDERGELYMEDDRVVLSTGQPILDDVYFVRNAQGELRWTTGSKLPLFGPDGEIVGLVGIAQDITERKQAEEALRESEARYRRIVETAHEGIWEFDADLRTTFANRQMAEMLGYTPDEMLGRSIEEFIHEDELEAHRAMMQERKRGLSSTYERRLRAKDGRVLHTLINATSEQDAEGRFIGSFAMVTDITERAEMEQALRDNATFLQTLIDAIPNPIFYKDTEGRFLGSNKASEEYGGVPREELIGKTVYDTSPPDLADIYTQMDAELFAHPGPQNYEALFSKPDGSRRNVIYHKATFTDAEGNVQGLVGMIQDITERVEMEQALARERTLLRTVIDNLPFSVYAKDRESRKTLANRANVLALGASSEEEVLGKTDGDFYPADIAASFEANDREVLSTGQPVLQRERQILREDGTSRWMLTSKLPLRDAAGEVTGLVGITQDITERKRAEEERLEMERQLQQAQKFESLGVLAGGIAHDFNNLLMAILGNLDLALLDLSPLSPARESILQAMQAGRRAADVARQMLAYSGRGRFVVQPVNLADLVEENAYMLRAAIARNVTLNLQLEHDLPAIEADPGQLQQVIINLITNASEAIGEKAGVVRLSTGVQHCDVAYLAQNRLPNKPEPGRYVFLEVADTGCGMDQATLARIFDPFFTTKATGRGLGMAVVQGIVSGHGGALLAQSEPGRGTTIRVLFAAAEQGAEPAPEGSEVHGAASKAKAEPPERAITILVVEDEAMVQRLGRTMLERLGYTVLTADDGEQALEVYRQHEEDIACVLLDLSMPRMDGASVAKVLLARRPGLPVILCSGYSEEENAQRFAELGLAGFIQKPFTLAALAATIEEALHKA